MDIFYRIECLSKLGFDLTIHVFEYGRGKQKELEKFGKVFYYKRNFSFWLHFSKIPFIVLSRKNRSLLENLLSDSAPILFEGIHTTYFLGHPKLHNRQKFVRAHNVEHEYYQQLGRHTHSLFKRVFFYLESLKLRFYEQNLKYATTILAIKSKDIDHFKQINSNIKLLPASISKELSAFHETKNFALFHGNLSVIENENAIYKIHEIIKSDLSKAFQFIVAGKNPTQNLTRYCAEQRILLVQNPSMEEMNNLISEARIHLFQSDFDSGVKLKLLKSINSCAHILTTHHLIFDSKISEFCHVANDENEFKTKFNQLKSISLTFNELKSRKEFLSAYFLQEEEILSNLSNTNWSF